MTYDNKGSFGELALLYNMPRAATVQVSQINLVLSKMRVFPSIIKKIKSKDCVNIITTSF